MILKLQSQLDLCILFMSKIFEQEISLLGFKMNYGSEFTRVFSF